VQSAALQIGLAARPRGSAEGRPTHERSTGGGSVDRESQVACEPGALALVTQLAAAEPGIRGRWSLGGTGWEVAFEAGFVPERGGWCVGPVRGFTDGQSVAIAPADEPRPGRLEPWAEAHAETARRFLGAIRGGRESDLARFEDGLAVQRVIGAALRADEAGRRAPIP
jgi:predicted dehydrogenase